MTNGGKCVVNFVKMRQWGTRIKFWKIGGFDEFWICAVFLYEYIIAAPNRIRKPDPCGGDAPVFTVFLNAATLQTAPFFYCFTIRQYHDLQAGIKK